MKRTTLIIAALGLFLFAQAAQADWTPAKRLAWTADRSEEPAIAVDPSGHLHVVWQDLTPGNYEIYYTRSADGGATWTDSRRLSWTSGTSYNPSLAVDPSGNLYVAWMDTAPGNWEVYFKKSTDGGTTWTPSSRLTWTFGNSEWVAIAADSPGNIHLAWQHNVGSNDEIHYRKSTDGGAAWTTSRRLTWTSGYSNMPAMAIDSSGHLHVVWWDDTPGNWEIYYKKSTDSGATWSTSQRLTWNLSISQNPVIAVDSLGRLLVVWHDYASGTGEIYCKKSADGGAIWSANHRLTLTSSGSFDPAIAADSFGGLHVVWWHGPSTSPEIFYNKSTDGGTTWTSSQRLTWTSGGSYDPAIAADSSGNLHVVWRDETPGNWEIYYKKFIK